MPIEFILGIISLPVLVIAVLAYYFGIKGIENKKIVKEQNRKTIENELIQNGMWKLVGADPITLDKIIQLLEDERMKTKIPEGERMRKMELLWKYRNSLRRVKKGTKEIVWNYKNHCTADLLHTDLSDISLPFNEFEAWVSSSPVAFPGNFKKD